MKQPEHIGRTFSVFSYLLQSCFDLSSPCKWFNNTYSIFPSVISLFYRLCGKVWVTSYVNVFTRCSILVFQKRCDSSRYTHLHHYLFLFSLAMSSNRTFLLCALFLMDILLPFSQFKVVRDTINHFLTFPDSKKQKPAIIIQHRALCSTLYKVVFPIQQVSSHMCFWLKVMTLPYLCLDKVSICWNIGCLFISTDTGKGTFRVTGAFRPPWKEEVDTERKLSSSGPPTGSGVCTKNLLMREWLSLARHFPACVSRKYKWRSSHRQVWLPMKLPAK